MVADNNVLSTVNAESVNWNIKDELKGLSLDEVNEFQPKLPYAVAMLNTTGSLNIGVAMRSSVIFGATKFYIAGNRHYDRRSTVGAQNYIDVERIRCYDEEKLNVSTLVDSVRADGFEPMVIEQGLPDITSIYRKDIGTPCFIFGEENAGVPEELIKFGGFSINQYGVLRSLNVSVAVGIALHHVSNYFMRG